jgi:hypothetical protein
MVAKQGGQRGIRRELDRAGLQRSVREHGHASHVERLEDALVHHGAERRRPRHPADDLAQQLVVQVGVDHAPAGRLDALKIGHAAEEAVDHAVAAEARVLLGLLQQPAAEAARPLRRVEATCVGQEVVDQHPVAHLRRQLGQVVARALQQPDAPVLDQRHDDRSRERLRGRHDPEERVGEHRVAGRVAGPDGLLQEAVPAAHEERDEAR